MHAIHDDPLPARRELVAVLARPGRSSAAVAAVPRQLHAGADRRAASGRSRVTLRYHETDLSLAVDEIVALVGYAPDASIYEQLQVHQCYATAGPMKMSAALLGGSRRATA